MIDGQVFSKWIQAFAQRLRSELGREALAVMYAELSAALDTEAFEVAARRVFRDHAYNTWPATAQFIHAAPRHLPRPDPDAVAEQQATRRLLASWDATPTPREQTLDEFSDEWRHALADCSPEALKREQLFSRHPDVWLTDERERALRDEIVRREAEARGYVSDPTPPRRRGAA